MNRFCFRTDARIPIAFFALMALAACAKSDEKPFLPVVAKVGAEVKAISAEEAQSVCKSNYCEDNQVYTADFGRKKHVEIPAPTPVKTPGVSPVTRPYKLPSQPSERSDYSKSMMNVQGAWNITEGSPSVVVAVIDTGADYFHPDLQANIVDVGYDFFHDRVGAYDDNGHGSHCAGVIAAGKNGIGIRGIAPNAKILPVKFLGPDAKGDTADAVKSIDYAVSKGVQVISNSWGGAIYSPLLDDAIQRAINKGVIVVAAAGNNNTNNDTTPNYPANYPGVISVGASNSSDLDAEYSNYGKTTVEIFAPGDEIYSTVPGGRYEEMSGTSMATPQVAGAIALALSVKPTVTLAELTADLCDTAAKKLLNYSKCGRMNVGAFIQRVSQ